VPTQSAVRLGFRALAFAQPERAMLWLAWQEREVQAMIPDEMRRKAWRLWLAHPNPHALDRALEWAGVATPNAPDTGPGEAAPLELRPAVLEDEVRRGVREALFESPLAGLDVLRRLPEALRCVVCRSDLQAVWTELLAAERAKDALLLIEAAPAALCPVPERGEIAALLASDDAEVRLSALRLVPLLSESPRPVGWEGGRGDAPAPPPAPASPRSR
jgi:hypothetical protein